MDTNLIDPSSISFEASKADIMAYLQGKEDYLRWSDFYASSIGQTYIELLAYHRALGNYRTISGRREAYAVSAKQRSSQVGIAYNRSYNVFRGRNFLVTVGFNPSVTRTLSKYEVIGSYNDQDIIVLNDTVINAGEVTPVLCTVGTVKEASITVSTTSLVTHQFKATDISDEYRLFLNADELQTSKNLLDLKDGKYVGVTNAFGGIDIFYLMQGENNYKVGDHLRVQYVSLYIAKPQLSNMNYDSPSDVVSAEITSYAVEPESIDSIKAKAPLAYETLRVVTARNDTAKNFSSMNSEFIDTNSTDISSAMVGVTYLKQDLTILSPSELDDFDAQLRSIRVFGVAPSIIVNPTFAQLKIDVSAHLKSNPSDDLTGYLDGILAQYQYVFSKGKSLIDILDIEDQLEEKSYIRVARASFVTTPWEANQEQEPISFVTSEGKLLQFDGHLRLSSDIEPVWPTVDGATVTDGRIVWQAMRDERYGIPVWAPNSGYDVGDIVMPTQMISNHFRYRVVHTLNYSGANAPVLGAIGSMVNDFEVKWLVVDTKGTPALWTADTAYKIGDMVVLDANATTALQCIGYISHTGSSAPVILGGKALDGTVIWKERDPLSTTLQTKWNQYVKINKTFSLKR